MRKKRGPEARQLQGVPNHPVVPLSPMRADAEEVVNPLGVAVGWRVSGSALFSWLPVRLPSMGTKAREVSLCAELVSLTDGARASLRWLWMDGDGGFHERGLESAPVDDGVMTWRHPIPLDLVEWGVAFSSALEVLTLETVLLRAAWLEVS